jgi:histidine triad (HIT) family protein
VECIFCAIVAGGAPGRRVAESDRALAFLDINPVADGHTLVLPKEHVGDIWGLADDVGADVWKLTMRVARRIREVLEPDGLTLFQANGRAGWQEVFHFHMHVVPRWTGDGLVRPRPKGPGNPRRLDEIAARLSEPAGDPSAAGR